MILISIADIQIGEIDSFHLLYFNNGDEGSALIAASWGWNDLGQFFITWDLLYLSFFRGQYMKLIELLRRR